MVPLETNYLGMYWTDLHHIFRIGTHMDGYDQSDPLFAISQGTLQIFFAVNQRKLA